jgi:aerobic-type carbon monoxide dehydrogenase small subunit (CoxS/CutS family)
MTAMNFRDIQFTVNGRRTSARVGCHEDAIDLLKRIGIFGARESCGQGLCGCCTIKIDGVAQSGCLTLAQLLDGTRVETVEGLDESGELSAVQQAFIEEQAFQCGFCTPGFIMMVTELLKENSDPSDDQIRGYLSGNLCRCATYPEVIRAVKSASQRLRVRAAS